MIRTRWMAVAGLLVVSGSGCEDPATVRAADLYGLWAAVSMVYTSHANPAVESDLLGSQGATYSIEMKSDGTYSSQLTRPSFPTVTETGTYELRNGRLILSPAVGGERTFSVELDRSLLTAREANTQWDFDQDGTPEAASLEMVLDRF